MALPWLTILKNVPWSTVIETAPVVADRAKKLWKNVAARSATPSEATDAPADTAPAAPSAAAASSDASPELLELEARLQARYDARLEAAQAEVAELRRQLLATTEFINTLADQNALLIQRAETNRVRIVWLTLAVVVLGIATIAAMVATVLR